MYGLYIERWPHGRRARAGIRAAVTLCACALAPVAAGVQLGGPPSNDYLSPALRGEVESLKAGVAREPATPTTVEKRARVLWRWANAFALDGGVLPVDLPEVLGVLLSWNLPALVSEADLQTVDRYVRELQVKEEWPEAMGQLSSDAGEPFPAASWQTIVQTYTVGEMPMVPGGGVLVAKHFTSNHGALQRDRPGADNYLSFACSNPMARFAEITVAIRGMHGGRRRPLQRLAYRLEEGTLSEGDTVRITYGDRSRGSRGFQVQTHANDFFPLPVYVDLEGEGNYFTLPLQPYAVTGKEVHAVKAFAPSIVQVGEPFEVSVRSEDFYYNRSSGPIPSYEVLLNGQPHSTISAGDRAITLLSGLTLDEPGIYRFEFRSPDRKVTGAGNPIWVRDRPVQRIYWGDLHAHGGFAEGQGTPAWFFRFAREDSRLDFLALSEHDLWMDDHEWELLRRAVRQYSVPGAPIAYLGYEWTMRPHQGGHHNVYFRTPEGRIRVGIHEAPTLSDLYRQLRAKNDPGDLLIVPHAHQAGDWQLSDPLFERLVELMSMHGTFEWFGRRYIDRGYQMGFVAASDDHLGHPGYTGTLERSTFRRGGLAAVLASEKTSDAIFSALRNLSTYATSGERMILDVWLNGAGPGARIPSSEERIISGRVIGTAPIDTITIVKNGSEISTWEYLTVPEASRTQAVMIELSSSAEEITVRAPRRPRTWKGELEVIGAEVADLAVPSFQNRLTDFASPIPDNRNRIRFATRTRGTTNALILTLKGASEATAVDLHVEAGVPGSPPIETRLSFSELEDGRVRRELEVEGYRDWIGLRLIDPRGLRDRGFELVDESRSEGDYYYVRVRQLDGSLAWSSPIWVGGSPPQGFHLHP